VTILLPCFPSGLRESVERDFRLDDAADAWAELLSQ
jgi:hypothetical protein